MRAAVTAAPPPVRTPAGSAGPSPAHPLTHASAGLSPVLVPHLSPGCAQGSGVLGDRKEAHRAGWTQLLATPQAPTSLAVTCGDSPPLQPWPTGVSKERLSLGLLRSTFLVAGTRVHSPGPSFLCPCDLRLPGPLSRSTRIPAGHPPQHTLRAGLGSRVCRGHLCTPPVQVGAEAEAGGHRRPTQTSHQGQASLLPTPAYGAAGVPARSPQG